MDINSMDIYKIRTVLTNSCHANMLKPLFYLVILLLPIIQACTTVNTIPQRAFPGETVFVSVGTPKGMTKSNTTVSFTPQGGSPIDLTSNVRAMFKLYPDPNSAAWNRNFNVQLVEPWTGHGPWTTVVAIELPMDLPTLPGIVEFVTSAGYPPLVNHLNVINIDLEILSGGPVTPSTFDYSELNGEILSGDLSQLEPLPRITVKAPDPAAVYPKYGAVEVTVNVAGLGTLIDDGIIADSFIRVILDHKTTFAHENRGSYTWLRNGDDIKVIFLSPTGNLQFTDVYFSIIPDWNPATITETNYYDINGNPVTGPILTITTGDIT